MAASSDVDVIVAGAGVGGAAVALALAQQYPSLRVLVAERRSGPGNVNRGDSMLPAVTAHLAAWNVIDRAIAAGARPISTMEVFHHRKGMVMQVPIETSRHPYLVLAHSDIERVLAEAALATSRVEICYNRRVTGLIEEGNRVCGAMITNGTGAPEAVRARLVVGADGSSSTIRDHLGIVFHRAPYNHSFFVIEFERPPQYRDAMRIELHPAGGMLVVPGHDRIGLAALVRKDEEAIFRQGSIDEKASRIRRRSPLLTDCREFPKSAHLYTLARSHAERYTARGAVLIGDAVHTTNPTAGQGMTMAVEDAAALAAHVGAALARGDSGASLDSGLAAYERERMLRNAKALRWSHWMSRFYALGPPFGDALVRSMFAFGGSRAGALLRRRVWSNVAVKE
jgi:2-octaprenyl-3-methyl-6-methoxy-1,4-benzoquinol hydroxylase